MLVSVFRRARSTRARVFALAVAALCCLTWAGARAYAERADYLGPRACKDCHEAAYTAWQKTAHARADQSLGPAPQARCLACHATGEAPAGRTFFSGVTCESCHGAGKPYATADIMRDRAQSRQLGLRDLSTPALRAALCAECHQPGTRITPFDAETAYQRIAH